MKLSNLNKLVYLFFFIFLLSSLKAEEDNVDIWNKNNLNKKNIESNNKENTQNKKIINTNAVATEIETDKIQVIKSFENKQNNPSIYGIYDPVENSFDLNMWSNSEGTKIKDTIDRISKIKLSKFAEEMFVTILLTNSYLPRTNMTDEEFLLYKFNWLIKNEKDDLIETFLNKNENFPRKEKLIKYLIDRSISKANLDEACNKISFFDSSLKDSYLERFKIICFIKDNKKEEAQLMYEILKEQKLSSKFFDSKVNFLLGIKNDKSEKILDDNLLNFYLSSITVKDFKYVPNKKTDPFIWKYLSASNLLRINELENKDQIRELEVAANDSTVDQLKIFEIYKNIEFKLSDFLRADDIYQSLDSIDSRALIYQKFLLSDSIENKIKYLFILNDLFKKDNLNNIFIKYLSNQLKELDTNKIPEKYIDLVNQNIILESLFEPGKIKYSDSSYHTSKIIRYYSENIFSKKNTEKDLKNTHKKIKKNKKYKLSLKDAILFEALKMDGFLIPNEINYLDIAQKNRPPIELLNFHKNNEIGLLALRIVELVGEDEITDFDEQSIYFISHLLNISGLKKLRNKVISTSLPLRG